MVEVSKPPREANPQQQAIANVWRTEDLDYLHGGDAVGFRTSIRQNTVHGLPVHIKELPPESRAAEPVKTPHILKNYRKDLNPAYTELLADEIWLDHFFTILNEPLSDREVHNLPGKVVNFLLHTGKLLLDATNDPDAPPQLISAIEPFQSNIRHLLWVLIETNRLYQQENGHRKWNINLGEPIYDSDLLEISELALPQIPGVQEMLTAITETLYIPVEHSPPANRYLISPGPGYANRFARQDFAALDSERMDDPATYRQKHDRAHLVTEFKKFGGLQTQFRALARLIADSAPENAYLTFREDPHITTNGKIQARLLDIPQSIKISELLSVLQKQFLSQFLGKPWGDVQSAGHRLIKLLNDATITFDEDRDNQYPEYHPLFRGFPSSQGYHLVSAALGKFIEEYVQDQIKRKEVKIIPDYLLTFALWCLIMVTLWSPVSQSVKKAEAPEKTHEALIRFAEALKNIGQSNEGDGKSFIQRFYEGLNATLALGNMDLLFSDNAYRGPENSPSSFAELRDLMAEPVFTSLKQEPDFMGYLPVRYEYDPNNPFAVIWKSDELLKFFSEDKYRKALDLQLYPDTKGALDSARGKIYIWEWDRLPVSVKERYGSFEELVEFDEDEMLLEFGYDKTYTVVDKILVNLERTYSDQNILIPLPVNATHMLVISLDNGRDSTESVLAVNTSGSRFLQLTSKEYRGPILILMLSQPIINGTDAFGLEQSSKESPTYNDRGRLITDDLAYRLPEVYGIRNTLPRASYMQRENISTETHPEHLSEEQIEFIKEWGIDFERILTELQSYSYLDLEKRSMELRSVPMGSKISVHHAIEDILFSSISKQLVEKGVRYSSDYRVNRYLSSNDVRSYFFAAETVGLDCDGLAFIHSLILNGFYKQYPQLRFEGESSEGKVQDYSFENKLNTELMLGELASEDNYFSGNVTHARNVLSVNFLQQTYEATTGFDITEEMSLEDLEAFLDRMEDAGYSYSSAQEKREGVLLLLALIGAVDAALLGARMRRMRRAEEARDRRLETLLGNLDKRNERWNRRIWQRLMPRLRRLNEEQIAALPHMLNLLLQEDYLPPKGSRKLNGIEYRVQAIMATDVRGTNKPALEEMASIKNLIKHLYQKMPDNPRSHREAKRALEILLSKERKLYLDPEKAQVLEAIDFLLKLRP